MWSDLRNLRGYRRYPAAFGVVVTATLTAELLYRTLETTRLSMIFLAGVVISAVWLGSGPAFFAAALAFIIYNFYLVDPRFTVQFASAEDFIVLAVFLVVAMLTGGLAGRVRDGARRSDVRARTTAALLAASREFALSTNEAGVRERLAVHLADAAKGDAVVWDGVRLVAEPPAASPPESLLRQVLELSDPNLFGAVVTTEALPWRARPLRSEDCTLGVAAWRMVGHDEAGDDEARLVNVLIDMAATAISRARLVTVQAETETLARTERLRNALLSSVSHDLRTPLTSILASASSLREFGERFTPEVRADLTLTIQEEAERLNLFVGNLLNFTRLESGGLRPDLAPVPVNEMIGRVMARIEPRRGARALTPVYTGRQAMVLGDPILLDQALSNVLENAVRYSADETEILILVHGDECVRIQVMDRGSGVPEAELDQIFDKFFRSSDVDSNAQGTGLGLSITRGFVEAMGGTVWAEARADGPGLVVVIELPRADEVKA
jgi:K+-sensing histidine kinase KdpD